MDDNSPYVDEIDRLDFVVGQVEGLMAVVLAIVKTHPDPALLATQINVVEQVSLAKNGASPISDASVDGIRDILDRVKKHADRVARTSAGQFQEPPRSPLRPYR